jgi:hypothetical protein
VEVLVMKMDNNIDRFHTIIFKERLPIWKMFSSLCWSFKINNSSKRSRLRWLNIKLKTTPLLSREQPDFYFDELYFFSGLPFWYCSKKLSPSAACTSITNNEMIVLIESFYHQKMLILASEKKFSLRDTPKVMLRKGNGKRLLQLWPKTFVSPFICQFLLCTHLLKLFRIFTPPPEYIRPYPHHPLQDLKISRK